MIKPTSITALQTFFFIATITSLVASIEQARDALRGTWVSALNAPLLAPFVRILAHAQLQTTGVEIEPKTDHGKLDGDFLASWRLGCTAVRCVLILGHIREP